MNRHLSSDEISRWMMGDRAPERRRHVEECAECRTELAAFDATLMAFRGSVRASVPASAPMWSARMPAQRRPLQWMLVAAALLVLLVSVPVYRVSRAREARRIAAAEAAAAASDALLLEQVDAEISRAVPEPMEPLVQLVSWGPAPADTKNNGKAQ